MSKPDELVEPLTRRELEILALLVQQRSNKEIASELSLSVNSVKWYARQIYGKLGIENRRQVTARAAELGLLEKDSIDGKSLTPQMAPSIVTVIESKPTHNLPLQLTSFVGRKEEIKQVRKLVSSSRLVTLTGPGGVGKTRLALAVASQLQDGFKDGCWLVELAPLGDTELIPGAIASIFGVHADQNRSLRRALVDYLREKQLLLILDNCEHLVDACAEIADTLLRACLGVTLLASSREALGIDGEVPFNVPSLSFPEKDKLQDRDSLQEFEAVQLFLERARLVVPGFAIDETNQDALSQVCRRLDGIPLALELAAARLQVLSLEQISARLDDRFRLLTGGSRRAVPRHQTLLALIGWSYELLTEAERTLLRRLSVFAGEWTLEAAEAVCARESNTDPSAPTKTSPAMSSAEVLDVLSGLVNKSLVTVERSGEKIRCYRMLETIRQFAREKLVESGEAERLHDRHLDYFMWLAEQSEPLLRGPDVLQRLELLDNQIANIQLALSWSSGGTDGARATKGLRLGCALEFYWNARGQLEEGSSWLMRRLDATRDETVIPSHLRAEVQFTIGFLVLNTLDFTKIALISPLLESSIMLFQKSDDRLAAALAQCELGACIMSKYITSFVSSQERTEYPSARALGAQGLATCRELGDSHDLAHALVLNLLIYSAGLEFNEARAFGEEALELCEKNGDKLLLGLMVIRLGSIALIQGDQISARWYIEKSLPVSQELHDRFGIMNSLIWSGLVAYYSQDFGQMETDFNGGLQISREIGGVIYMMFSLRNLGIAALRQCELDRSKIYFLENLSYAEKFNRDENQWVKYDLDTFILGMAGISLETGKASEAARMLGAVEVQIESFYKPLDPWDQAEFDRILRVAKLQMDEASFTVAWSAGRELTLDQALTEARQIAL